MAPLGSCLGQHERLAAVQHWLILGDAAGLCRACSGKSLIRRLYPLCIHQTAFLR